MLRKRAGVAEPLGVPNGRPGETCAQRLTRGNQATQQPAPRWRSPYQRARHELAAGFRRAGQAGRAVEAMELLARNGGRPTSREQLRIFRNFPRLDALLSSSVRHYTVAVAALQTTHERALENQGPENREQNDPAVDLTDLVDLMAASLGDLVTLAATVLALQQQIAALSGWCTTFLAEACFPTEPAPVPESATVRLGRAIAAAPPVPPPPHRRRLGDAHMVARRICRGRAPPLAFSTCPL